MTNKQYEIDNYFNSIPVGTILIPHIGPREIKSDTIPYSIAGDKLKDKFPNLIFPQDSYYIEGFIFGFNFLEKEHIKLFYEMWDILSYEFQTKNPQHLYMQSGRIGYCVLDPVIAYITRIFEINFNYKIKNYLEHWDNEKLGFHITCPHDAWYYSLNVLPGWNLHYPLEEDKIYTVKDYIKKNKDALINYYQNHITHCNLKITEDNQIIITHEEIINYDETIKTLNPKLKDKTYGIDEIKYEKLCGSREDVWNGKAYKTTGGLIKEDLLMHKSGKIISKRKCILETNYKRFVKSGVNKDK
jgi:hypothetical protein